MHDVCALKGRKEAPRISRKRRCLFQQSSGCLKPAQADKRIIVSAMRSTEAPVISASVLGNAQAPDQEGPTVPPTFMSASRFGQTDLPPAAEADAVSAALWKLLVLRAPPALVRIIGTQVSMMPPPYLFPPCGTQCQGNCSCHDCTPKLSVSLLKQCSCIFELPRKLSLPRNACSHQRTSCKSPQGPAWDLLSDRPVLKPPQMASRHLDPVPKPYQSARHAIILYSLR